MSADKRPVQPGEVLTFALNFGNRSAGTSTGTAMSASVPEGTSFLSATGGGTHVGEEVQWDLGSLAPGENGVRRFKVTVIPGLAAGRQVASIAEIENGARSQSAQTKCFVPVQVNPPLNVSVVFSPNPVRPSGILNVLLTASNQGAGDFTDVELAHTLPAGVGSASVDTSPVTGQIGDGDTFRWNLGTLAVGQSVTRGYTLLVDGGAFSRPEGTLQRHFTRLHEPLGSEAMDQTDVRIEHDEDLMMRVRTNRGPVAPGETLKHTVDFTNRGSSTLTFVELRAQVPEGSTFVSASDNGLLVGDQVEWNIGTLEAGAGNQRRFTVTVDGDAEDGDHMVSLAEISDGSGDHSGEAKAATPVLSESPFVLSMALSQDPQRPGEVMHALMTLTNRGTLDLPDVVLRHTLPQHSGSVKLDEAHSGGSLVDAGTFFWELGTLGAGRSVTRGFSYLVDGGAFSPPEGTLLWHVARASNSIGNEANALAGVRIDATDDLSLRIAADHAPAAPAEELTFALTYTNRGASEVSGVTLRAPVPEGTAFSSATGGGVLSNGEVAWTLGAVGSGQGGKVEYTVTVDSGLGDGQQVNAFAELNGAGGALGSQANCDVPVRDAAPLALAMTASADPASPAATVTYNLTVSNVSASELVDVVLRVTLPNHIGSGAAGTPVSGGTVNDTNTFFWNLGSIPATTDVMRSFSFVIDGGAFTPPPGTMLRVSARVDDAVGNEAIKQLDIRVE
jgi:uncharacterized repeat protein (TIGR01451 family)